MDALWRGPQAQTRDQRHHLVARIVDDLQRVYGASIHAIALYGSTARDADGPYSDVELWVALNTPGVDATAEWVYGPGKAEVNLYGLDVVWQLARAVEDDWALTQGAFANCRPLMGDPAFFAALRAAALEPDPEEVAEVVAEMVVGECYEWLGKARNAIHTGHHQALPSLAVRFAEHVACMAGLLHRRPFAGGAMLLHDVLHLPDLPQSYVELAQRAGRGELADPHAVAANLEATWAGLEAWLARHNVKLDARTVWPWP